MLPQMLIFQTPTQWNAPTGKEKRKKVMLVHKIKELLQQRNTTENEIWKYLINITTAEDSNMINIIRCHTS